MNDRFKFRAWDKINDEWVKTPYLSLDVETGMLNGFFDYTEAAKRRYTLEQCTGLKDKNGKLIYEGDIVKLSSDREVVCPVVWDNEETGFCVKYKKELYRFNTYKKYHLIEIIGNIHENADLLENEE